MFIIHTIQLITMEFFNRSSNKYTDQTSKLDKHFNGYSSKISSVKGLWNPKEQHPNYGKFMRYPLTWYIPSLINRFRILLGFLDKEDYYSKIKMQVIQKLNHAQHVANSSFAEKSKIVRDALSAAENLLLEAQQRAEKERRRSDLTKEQATEIEKININLEAYIKELQSASTHMIESIRPENKEKQGELFDKLSAERKTKHN